MVANKAGHWVRRSKDIRHYAISLQPASLGPIHGSIYLHMSMCGANILFRCASISSTQTCVSQSETGKFELIGVVVWLSLRIYSPPKGASRLVQHVRVRKKLRNSGKFNTYKGFFGPVLCSSSRFFPRGKIFLGVSLFSGAR